MKFLIDLEEQVYGPGPARCWGEFLWTADRARSPAESTAALSARPGSAGSEVWDELDLELGNANVAQDMACLELEVSSPSQELEIRSLPRLGSLQISRGGAESRLQRLACSPWVPADVAEPSTLSSSSRTPAPVSGLDPEPVRRWIQGEISFAKCLVSVLDAVQLKDPDRGSSWPSPQRELSRALKLFAPSPSTGGQLLAALAGGLPQALLSTSGLPFADDVGLDALLAAMSRRRAPSGASSETELLFRRGRLRAHPSREKGSTESLMSEHFAYELQRQSMCRGNSTVVGKQEELHDGVLLSLLTDTTGADDEAAQPHLLRLLKELTHQRDNLEAALQSLRNKDAYRLLGLHPGASTADLGRAYRGQARKLHPDRNGSKESFQALQEAYELLRTKASFWPVAEPVGSLVIEDSLSMPDVPMEEWARQAEAACELAIVCCRLGEILEGEGSGSLRPAAQLREAARQTGQVSGLIGRATASLPPQLVALVEAARRHSGTSAGLMQHARELLRQLLGVAGLGERVAALGAELGEPSRGDPQECNKLAELAKDAALGAAAAVVAAGEALQVARNLLVSLQQTDSRNAEVDPDSLEAAEDLETALQDLFEEDGSDFEELGCAFEKATCCASSCEGVAEAIRQLNRQVSQQQRALREMLVLQPSLLPEVSPAEKLSLFAIVAQLIEEIASKVLNVVASSTERVGISEEFLVLATVATALGSLFAAACDQVARPSLEARIFRLAKEVDTRHFWQLLEELLLSPCLDVIPVQRQGLRALLWKLQALGEEALS